MYSKSNQANFRYHIDRAAESNDSMTMANIKLNSSDNTTRKTGVTAVKKIYRYLSGSLKEANKFVDELKIKYPEAFNKDNNAWEFDEDILMNIFISNNEFKNKLEEEYLDTFDKLHYWVVRKENSIQHTKLGSSL